MRSATECPPLDLLLIYLSTFYLSINFLFLFLFCNFQFILFIYFIIFLVFETLTCLLGLKRFSYFTRLPYFLSIYLLFIFIFHLTSFICFILFFIFETLTSLLRIKFRFRLSSPSIFKISLGEGFTFQNKQKIGILTY